MHSSFFVEYLNSGHYNFTGTTREGHARWVMKVGEFLSFFFCIELESVAACTTFICAVLILCKREYQSADDEVGCRKW